MHLGHAHVEESKKGGPGQSCLVVSVCMIAWEHLEELAAKGRATEKLKHADSDEARQWRGQVQGGVPKRDLSYWCVRQCPA